MPVIPAVKIREMRRSAERALSMALKFEKGKPNPYGVMRIPCAVVSSANALELIRVLDSYLELLGKDSQPVLADDRAVVGPE